MSVDLTRGPVWGSSALHYQLPEPSTKHAVYIWTSSLEDYSLKWRGNPLKREKQQLSGISFAFYWMCTTTAVTIFSTRTKKKQPLEFFNTRPRPDLQPSADLFCRRLLAPRQRWASPSRSIWYGAVCLRKSETLHRGVGRKRSWVTYKRRDSRTTRQKKPFLIKSIVICLM